MTVSSPPTMPPDASDSPALPGNDATSLAEPEETGWSLGLTNTMLLVVAIRLFIFITGYVSISTAPNVPHLEFNHAHPWMAWDAREYYELALHGYSPDRIGRPYREWNTFVLIAYFPMVPLIGRALSTVFPVDVGLLLLSNLCSLAAFAFLYDFSRRRYGARVATIAVLIAATFPGAVAFAAGMTEGLFFLLVAMTLWLLDRRQFYAAAIVAGIATATRPTGIALAIIVPCCALMQLSEIPVPRRLLHFVALGLISITGLVSYQSFLWHRYDSPTAYFEAQADWKQRNEQRIERDAEQGMERYSFQFFKDRILRPQVWNRGIALLVSIVILAGLVRPQGIPRLFFLLPLIILLVTSVPDKGLRISSVPRYESCAVPLFVLMGIWFHITSGTARWLRCWPFSLRYRSTTPSFSRAKSGWVEPSSGLAQFGVFFRPVSDSIWIFRTGS